MGIEGCELISFPRRTDVRGSLTFIEHPTNLPFAVKRVFYIYEIPENQSRGAHAHRVSHQLVICVTGAFTITLDDGLKRETRRLANPAEGLWVRPETWVSLSGFEAGSVGLVLASDLYDESDYIREYDDFLRLRGRLARVG